MSDTINVTELIFDGETVYKNESSQKEWKTVELKRYVADALTSKELQPQPELTILEEVAILEQIEKEFPKLSDEYLIILYNEIMGELGERKILNVGAN